MSNNEGNKQQTEENVLKTAEQVGNEATKSDILDVEQQEKQEAPVPSADELKANIGHGTEKKE